MSPGTSRSFFNGLTRTAGRFGNLFLFNNPRGNSTPANDDGTTASMITLDQTPKRPDRKSDLNAPRVPPPTHPIFNTPSAPPAPGRGQNTPFSDPDSTMRSRTTFEKNPFTFFNAVPQYSETSKYSVLVFCKDIETLRTTADLSDEETMKAALWALRGSFKERIIHNVEFKNCKNWEDLKKFLIKELYRPPPLHAIFAQISKLKQRSNEAVRDYNKRFQETLQPLMLDKGFPTYQPLVITLYIQSLRNQQIVTVMVSSVPSSLTEAFNKAVEIEDVLPQRDIYSNLNNVEKMETNGRNTYEARNYKSKSFDNNKKEHFLGQKGRVTPSIERASTSNQRATLAPNQKQDGRRFHKSN